MMRNAMRVFGIISLPFLACLLMSCAGPGYAILSFEGAAAHVVSEGKADRHAAASLLHPPSVWGTPAAWDNIPANATACGVLVVTHGTESSIGIPLLMWNSTNAVPVYGCVGPVGSFFVRAVSRSGLFEDVESCIRGRRQGCHGPKSP